MIRRLPALLAATALAVGAALLPAAPAHASPLVPGGFCDAAEVGDTRQVAGTSYTCTQGGRGTQQWKRTPLSQPAPTCTVGAGQCPYPTPSCNPDGYSRPCKSSTPPPSSAPPSSAPPSSTPPSSSSPPATPTPSTSTDMVTLPRTDSTNSSRIVAGAVVLGIVLVLIGAALVLITSRRRRRRGAHHRTV
jgi:hypothetical protein